MSFALNSIYRNTHVNRNLLGSAWRLESRKHLFMEIIDNHLLWNKSKETDKMPLYLLDVGGRDGTLVRQLELSCHLTVVDVDSNALLRYKLNFPTATVKIVDCNENLPFDSESFDIVLAGEIIEHLISPGLFLSEVRRVLKPGGLFTGSTPNAFRFDKRFQLLLGNDPKTFSDPTHTQYFSYDSLNQILKRYFQSTEIMHHSRNKLSKVAPRIFSDGFIWQAKN